MASRKTDEKRRAAATASGVYVTSVDDACPDGPKSLLALVVASSGTDHWSRIFRVSDLRGAGTSPVVDLVVELHEWVTSMWRCADGTLHLSCADGSVYELAPGTSSPTTHVLSAGRGLTRLGGSDESLCAVGSDGVFTRAGEVWVRASPPLSKTLFGIAASRRGALLACGSGGAWQGDRGGTWEPLHLPTDTVFTDVVSASDGTTWICGKGGALFRSADDARWERVGHSQQDLHGLCEHGGSLYVSAGEAGVARLTSAGELEIVKASVVSYSVASDGEFLVSAGGQIVIRTSNAEVWAGARFD